jgi:hypothetical protein
MLKHRRIGRYTGQPCFDRQRLSPCRSKRRLIASSLLHPSSQARCFSSSSKTRYSASITPADFAKTFGAEILTIDG